LVKGKKLIISNFVYLQRKKEITFYENWYRENDFEIKKIPENLFFEGAGESLWWEEKLFVGNGLRNSAGIDKIIKEALRVEVIALRLVNPRFYHLDTCLFPLNRETVFYYPEALASESIKTLKKIVPDLIPIEKKEAYNFAANSVVTDHHAVIQRGNPALRKKLTAYNYKAVEVDVSEFFKAGGGVHCLTGVVAENVV
jgi:N-dimethylarginine dimethylaminohydrolase